VLGSTVRDELQVETRWGCMLRSGDSNSQSTLHPRTSSTICVPGASTNSELGLIYFNVAVQPNRQLFTPEPPARFASRARAQTASSTSRRPPRPATRDRASRSSARLRTRRGRRARGSRCERVGPWRLGVYRNRVRAGASNAAMSRFGFCSDFGFQSAILNPNLGTRRDTRRCQGSDSV